MSKHHSKAYWRKFYALQSESKMEFENAPGATYKALDDVSSVRSDDESGKCRVRQGNTWRNMGGKPFIPYGSDKFTRGKREYHDHNAEAHKYMDMLNEQKYANWSAR